MKHETQSPEEADEKGKAPSFDQCRQEAENLKNRAQLLTNEQMPENKKTDEFLTAVMKIPETVEILDKHWHDPYHRPKQALKTLAGLKAVSDLLTAVESGSLFKEIHSTKDPDALILASSQLTSHPSLQRSLKIFEAASGYSDDNIVRNCHLAIQKVFYTAVILNSEIIHTTEETKAQKESEEKKEIGKKPLADAIKVLIRRINAQKDQLASYSVSQLGALANLIRATEFAKKKEEESSSQHSKELLHYLYVLFWEKSEFLTSLSAPELQTLKNAGFCTEIISAEELCKHERISQLAKQGVLNEYNNEIPQEHKWGRLYTTTSETAGLAERIETGRGGCTFKDSQFSQGSFAVNKIGISPYIVTQGPDSNDDVCRLFQTLAQPFSNSLPVVGIVGLGKEGRDFSSYHQGEFPSINKELTANVTVRDEKSVTGPWTRTPVTVKIERNDKKEEKSQGKDWTFFNISIKDNTTFGVTAQESSICPATDRSLIAAKDLYEPYRLSEKGLLVTHCGGGIGRGPSLAFTFLILDYVFTPEHEGEINRNDIEKIFQLYAYLCSYRACTSLTREQFARAIENAYLLHQYELQLPQEERKNRPPQTQWKEIIQGTNPFAHRVIMEQRTPLKAALLTDWIAAHWWEHDSAPWLIIAASIIEGVFLANKLLVTSEMSHGLLIQFTGGLIGATVMASILWTCNRLSDKLPERIKNPGFIGGGLALALVGPLLAVEFVPVLINHCPQLGNYYWALFAGFMAIIAVAGAKGQILADSTIRDYHKKMGRFGPAVVAAFLTSILFGVPFTIELMPKLIDKAGSWALPLEILTVVASAAVGFGLTFAVCHINKARENHYAFFPYSKKVKENPNIIILPAEQSPKVPV